MSFSDIDNETYFDSFRWIETKTINKPSQNAPEYPVLHRQRHVVPALLFVPPFLHTNLLHESTANIKVEE